MLRCGCNGADVTNVSRDVTSSYGATEKVDGTERASRALAPAARTQAHDPLRPSFAHLLMYVPRST